MNTRILIAVVVSLFVVCQQVYAQDDEPVMPEATELEGTWELVSWVVDGEQVEPNGRMWRFEGDRMYSQRSGDEGWRQTGTLSVNPSEMPAEVDYVIDTYRIWGIYELDDGLLTICFDTTGTRPDRFESTEDYPTQLFVLRRVEDDE